MSVVNRLLVIAGLSFLPLQSLPGQKPAGLAPTSAASSEPLLLNVMADELGRAMTDLAQSAQPNQPAPYYVAYHTHDLTKLAIEAQHGAIMSLDQNHQRTADIVVRVGDWKLDNTHGSHRNSALHTIDLPLEDNRAAIARSLWWGTNAGYANALQAYLKVKSDLAVQAPEEDASPDFSHQDPVRSTTAPMALPQVNRATWETRMRALSAIFRAHPGILSDFVAFTLSTENDYFVSSEGSRIIDPQQHIRIVVTATTRADDGMNLTLARTFEGRSEQDLPSQAELQRQISQLADQLDALRRAPTAEPFDGPVLLSGRAAAVFFHEVLGHRLEGQRQRGNQEGQTFTKDVGKPILPAFLSVVDDPTIQALGATHLSGYYSYDDEGQPAQRTVLVKDGVLESFLMSRMPVNGFDVSNGHGRAQPGKMPAARQGNLIVAATQTTPAKQLRSMLIEQIRKQNKPYGLYFEDIISGFTLTQRVAPQAFEVIPQIVYRVYADGRPDELVRGVQIVGTPQESLTKIVAAGDTQAIFNGECGAESGIIPVSAVAPALLFSEMETQKAAQGSARPPVLPPPDADSDASSSTQEVQ
jgi:TldD protein